jgi:hypothetical protein
VGLGRLRSRAKARKESGSFLKKRTKKLLSVGDCKLAAGTTPGRAAHLEVFWFFFSKKNRLLA